jgi:uncharacterized membrane protein YphA (DoxX/SURF4 family)
MNPRVRHWIDRLDESIDPRPLVPLRLAIGPLVLLHLQPFLERATDGIIYRDRFWLPYADWYPHLPRGAYVALLWTAVAAGFFVSIGLVTRLAAWVCAAAVAYNLFLSQTHFHHNRAFLLIVLVGVAVLPVGASTSIDRLVGIPGALSRGGGRWLALTVLRIEIALVYLASGVSKLLDADWWGGTVTRLRVVAGLDRVPDAFSEVLTDPGFHAWAAKAIVLTEVFIGVGLLWRRTRLGAVWVAIPFHLAIEATAAVQVFSWAALMALVVWVTPTSTDRHLQVPHRWQARVVQALDWTGRFRVSIGAGVELADRDGRVRHGRDATRFTATRLPLTFWVMAPLAPGRGAYPSADTEKGPP